MSTPKERLRTKESTPPINMRAAFPVPVALFEDSFENNPSHKTLSLSSSSFNTCLAGPQRMPDPPKKAASPTVKECLMVPGRRAKQVQVTAGSFVYCDCSELTRDQVEVIKKKAVQLEMSYHVTDQANDIKRAHYAGQAGYIDGLGLVTARHNVSNDESVIGNLMEFKGAYALLDGSTGVAPVNFSQENFDLTTATPLPLSRWKNWKCGWDITVGPKPWLDSLWKGPSNEFAEKLLLSNVGESRVFDQVRKDFKYEKGQRIGIVISTVQMTAAATTQTANVYGRNQLKKWMNSNVTKESHVNDIKKDAGTQTDISMDPSQSGDDEASILQDCLDDIYGLPGYVCIYTGEITRVGADHIEHNINTFTSCSGAIVFLLPVEGQPESVESRDHGTAIAVHVGYNDLLGDENQGANLGLKLHPKSWGKQLFPTWH